MTQPQLQNRIKQARVERDLSQIELADRVGVTRQTISSIETNRYVPSTLLALLLARVLEKPVESLFYLDGESP